MSAIRNIRCRSDARRLIWQFSEGDRSRARRLARRPIVDANDQALDWLSPACSVRLWHPPRLRPSSCSTGGNGSSTHRRTALQAGAPRGLHPDRCRTRHARTRTGSPATCCCSISSRPSVENAAGNTGCKGDWDSANTPTRRLRRWGLDVEFWVEAPEGPIDDWRSHTRVFTGRAHRSGPLQSRGPPSIGGRAAARVLRSHAGRGSIRGRVQRRQRSDVGGPGPRAVRRLLAGYAVGELSESSKTRRAVLEALIPRLEIATGCRSRSASSWSAAISQTYKIHLGSGNVLMEPGSQLPLHRCCTRTGVRTEA